MGFNERGSPPKVLPKKHLKIPERLIRRQLLETHAGGPKGDLQARETKKIKFKTQLSDVVDYRNKFNIWPDDSYYAELTMDQNIINVFDKLSNALSIDVLKYSDKYALVSIDTNNFDKFKEKLFKNTYLDKVSEIKPYKDRIDPYLKLLISERGENDKFEVEVDFFPKLDKKRYEKATNAIRDFLSQQIPQFDKNDIYQDLDKVYLRTSGRNIKKIGSGVATISKIHVKPELIVESPKLIVSRSFQGKIPLPENASSINIIDTGIETQNPLIDGWVGETADYSNIDQHSEIPDYVSLPKSCPDNEGHGTFISGLACYGNEKLERGNLKPEFIINMAKLMDGNHVSVLKLLKTIPRIISDFKKHSRVFNLSINVEQKSDQMSDDVLELCEKIDKIARTEDLIFCVSAGNINDE